jgi:hypothetical protein
MGKYDFSIKGKVVPVHTVKVYRANKGIATLILNLSTRQRGMVNFTLRPLYSQERNVVHVE